tara:strand:- start:2710 stop:2943 length:234 start_codon:yes stop_codon:yes gene_type:complete
MKLEDQIHMDLSVQEALMILSGLQREVLFYKHKSDLPYSEERIEEIKVLNRKVKVFLFGEEAVAHAEEQLGGSNDGQ